MFPAHSPLLQLATSDKILPVCDRCVYTLSLSYFQDRKTTCHMLYRSRLATIMRILVTIAIMLYGLRTGICWKFPPEFPSCVKYCDFVLLSVDYCHATSLPSEKCDCNCQGVQLLNQPNLVVNNIVRTKKMEWSFNGFWIFVDGIPHRYLELLLTSSSSDRNKIY